MIELEQCVQAALRQVDEQLVGYTVGSLYVSTSIEWLLVTD